MVRLLHRQCQHNSATCSDVCCCAPNAAARRYRPLRTARDSEHCQFGVGDTTGEQRHLDRCEALGLRPDKSCALATERVDRVWTEFDIRSYGSSESAFLNRQVLLEWKGVFCRQFIPSVDRSKSVMNGHSTL